MAKEDMIFHPQSQVCLGLACKTNSLSGTWKPSLIPRPLSPEGPGDEATASQPPSVDHFQHFTWRVLMISLAGQTHESLVNETRVLRQTVLGLVGSGMCETVQSVWYGSVLTLAMTNNCMCISKSRATNPRGTLPTWLTCRDGRCGRDDDTRSGSPPAWRSCSH